MKSDKRMSGKNGSANSVLKYGGTPIKVDETLQKFVTRFPTTDTDIPMEIIDYISSRNREKAIQYTGNINLENYAIGTTITASIVDKEAVIWVGTDEGMIRIDTSERDKRDRVQYFIGTRYFYGLSNKVKLIVSDNNRGVWVLTDEGVSHIEMRFVEYSQKARLMSTYTQKHVSRRGMVSQAKWINDKWQPSCSDNDGLWTAMYGAGECFRYVLETDPQNKEEAKKLATRAVEAALLLANISSRDGKTDAKIRHFVNDSNEMSREYVKKDGDIKYFYPTEGPVGMKLDNLLDPLETHRPRTSEDWVITGEPETQKRTLKGFVARTYYLDGLETEPIPIDDGFFFKKMIKDEKKIAKCMPFDPETGPDDPLRAGYDKLNYRTKVVEDFAGVEVDASLDIPTRLANLYRSVRKEDGTYYTDTDVIYKADTSTDEIIGHLFLYKIAYDTLCVGEDGDHELGKIIIDTSRNLAQHLLDNGYCLVDGTGQPTLWGKMSREYFNSIYAWDDCALNCLVLLSAFKVATYLTGEEKWELEYKKLALSEPYRYADLACEYRERYNHAMVYMYRQENPYASDDDPRLDPNSKETNLEVQLNLNYSDEEMAMLAFYLLFQIETDPILIEKYRTAIDAWWISMQYSDNPLWIYIYQLAYPDSIGKADLKTAAWALKRHPVDTRVWITDNTMRRDIVNYKNTNKAMSKEADGWFVALPMDERYMRKYNACSFIVNGFREASDTLEGSTTYTLPYWLGRFHGMIAE